MINPNIIPNGGRHGLKICFILKIIDFQYFIFIKKVFNWFFNSTSFARGQRVGGKEFLSAQSPVWPLDDLPLCNQSIPC